MTLLTADSIVTHVGNASTVAFPYSRKFISNSHVFVTLDGVATTAYTLIGAGSESGGTVTFNTAPGSGVRIVIYRAVPFTQETDLENFDGNPAVVHENQLDLIVMQTQNLDERVDRALVAPVDDVNVSLVLPKASARANGYPYFGTSGEILVTTDAAGVSAAAAAASASAASASASSASSSAATAAAIAGSAVWSNVVFLTSASSPYSVTSANSGDLLSIDTSGGAVVITLPQISTLTLPFNIGIKKATSDTNVVTINRSSTDTIGAAGTSKTLSVLDQGVTLVADTDPAPDQWVPADFGNIGTVIPSQSGNSGKFLTTNGTVASWGVVTTPGSVLLNTTTVSSPVATVDFVNGSGGVVLDGTYKSYIVQVINVIPTANDEFYIRTSTNAGSSYDSGAGNYAYVVGGADSIPSTSLQGSNSSTFIKTNVNSISNAAANSGANGWFSLQNPVGTSRFCVYGQLGYANPSGNFNTATVFGQRLASADVDGIRFFFSSTTIASGTFKLYGVN
jgi:hypothetical protein